MDSYIKGGILLISFINLTTKNLNKKLNILFIASWYPTRDKPFNGDFIQRHAKAVALYCNVTVVHIAPALQKEKFIIEEKQNENIREIRVFHRKINFGVSVTKRLRNYIIKRKAFKMALQMVQKSGNIDLVHLNVLFPSGIFALYMKKKYNIPYIITEHWSKFLPDSENDFTNSELFLIKRIVNNAETVCPVSDNLKNAMLSMGLEATYQIIPNVVNTNLFFLSKDKEKSDKLRFVHVSSMEDGVKNITGILDAVKKAHKLSPDFTLTFVGGDDIEIYRQYADNIGIPDGVLQFTGIVNYEKVAEIIQQKDVFLMFSNYENLPCVISEALVCGLPVIASAVGGTPEMIDETNGCLVKKQDVDELAERIVKIIKFYSFFDRESIVKKAKLKYSYEVVGKQYYNLYRKILSGNKK